MKVAAIQYDILWEDPPGNFERLAPRIATAAASGARLVVLPEMFACGFSMNTSAIREPASGPSSRFLARAAAQHGIYICGSVPELPEAADPGVTNDAEPRPANTLVIASPDGSLSRYRKIHPFTFAGEHEHYTAGHDFLTLNIEGVRATFFICYDLRFADEFWATAHTTDVYIVPANWPERRRLHWSTLLRARAIENQAYVVGVNRVGVGSGLTYMGDSAIIDPWGEVLVAAAGDETILVADIDPARVRDAREKFPVFADRRPQ